MTLEEIRETFEEGGIIATQAFLEGKLKDLFELRVANRKTENFIAGLVEMIMLWMNANPGESLVDGERGYKGYLQPRQGATPYDLVALREQDPLLFQRLLNLGCLTVNAKAVAAQGVQVAGVSKYAGPRPVTYSLQVVKT